MLSCDDGVLLIPPMLISRSLDLSKVSKLHLNEECASMLSRYSRFLLLKYGRDDAVPPSILKW